MLLSHFKWKIKGVTRRWLINVMSVVVAVIVIVETLLSIFIVNYYNETARSRANELCQGFSLLATVDPAEFPAKARQYIENFEHKDKIEVQIIDANGKILITSNGFNPGEPDMPDYNSALSSDSSTALWTGTSQGEEIMAQTTILGDYGTGSNGAIRWLISLDSVNEHITWLILLCIVIGLGIIAITAMTGLYFIKSIVRPVREVSNVARKMAMGDFKSRLEVKKNDDEIGELCDAINYMASELGQAENVKNSFISSVSHELRTPLTAIRGWGETAKMSLGFDDELVAKGVDVILSEADRLSGLVEDLLDFSRMQSGRLSVNMRRINVIAPLKTAADMYLEVAKQHKIKMDFVCPADPNDVMGDPDRLKQVFINVIDNAIKYSNDGGSVLIDCHEEEHCIHIRISDTGVGIPAQDIDKVKEKFFKSNTTVRGSGIGLAVADEIIKQHNGLLFIESTEGVGTTVTIVLPVIDSDNLPEKETESAALPAENINEDISI